MSESTRTNSLRLAIDAGRRTGDLEPENLIVAAALFDKFITTELNTPKSAAKKGRPPGKRKSG
ncbi:MAG: hypothetical protein ACE5DY_06645 [Mariprofundaceae bacterium]